jgi:hypothetical protein
MKCLFGSGPRFLDHLRRYLRFRVRFESGNLTTFGWKYFLACSLVYLDDLCVLLLSCQHELLAKSVLFVDRFAASIFL